MIFFVQLGNSAAGMQDSGVVAIAERIPDVRQTYLCQVSGQRHCHLAGSGDVSGSFFGMKVGEFQFVKIRDGPLNILNGYLTVLGRDEVL